MKVLCAIGVRGGAELVRLTAERVGADTEWLLLHVIDVGPRRDLEHFGPAHRPPPPPHPPHSPHESELDRAEETGGEEALKEALDQAQALGLRSETRLERGEPNHVIVEIAESSNADLIAMGARERAGHPDRGPASVGHTARFVLDHAPCDVLLLRRGKNI